MPQATRHDAWQAGDAYEQYMGRWSRRIAPRFVDWLSPEPGLDWLDVGCGTGALSEAVLGRSDPGSLVAVDQSEGFLATARANVRDGRAEFRAGDAQALPLDDHSCDVVVSALMLNFVPDREKALAEMQRVARPQATVVFYDWEYPGGGVA